MDYLVHCPQWQKSNQVPLDLVIDGSEKQKREKEWGKGKWEPRALEEPEAKRLEEQKRKWELLKRELELELEVEREVGLEPGQALVLTLCWK